MVAAGISMRDRLVAGLGTAIVLMLFGYLLVRGLTVGMAFRQDRPIALLDLHAPPPPPPPKPPRAHPKPKQSAASSPPNLRSKATPIVAPPPILPPPLPPPPVIVAPKADIGAATSTGASDRAGLGTGAGGEGDGAGGGGDGDGGTPPRQISGRLKFSDMPADLREASVTGIVAVRYDVETDGHATECEVTKSSGHAELDALTCKLIERRFRFRPSHDRDGDPVVSTIVETHGWVIDRGDYAAP